MNVWGRKFVSSEVKDDVYKFLKTYQAQINEGYTVIQGEKRLLVTRQNTKRETKDF